MEEYQDTFDDYLELYIQFGYVFLFSSVYPIAALWALLNNVLEIRADAFKMCQLFRRPFIRKVKDIGAWQVSPSSRSRLNHLTVFLALLWSPRGSFHSDELRRVVLERRHQKTLSQLFRCGASDRFHVHWATFTRHPLSDPYCHIRQARVGSSGPGSEELRVEAGPQIRGKSSEPEKLPQIYIHEMKNTSGKGIRDFKTSGQVSVDKKYIKRLLLCALSRSLHSILYLYSLSIHKGLMGRPVDSKTNYIDSVSNHIWKRFFPWELLSVCSPSWKVALIAKNLLIMLRQFVSPFLGNYIRGL